MSVWQRFTRWVRHHKLNPIPCTCFDCEMKKPLPPILKAYLEMQHLKKDKDAI